MSLRILYDSEVIRWLRWQMISNLISVNIRCHSLGYMAANAWVKVMEWIINRSIDRFIDCAIDWTAFKCYDAHVDCCLWWQNLLSSKTRLNWLIYSDHWLATARQNKVPNSRTMVHGLSKTTARAIWINFDILSRIWVPDQQHPVKE